MHDDREQVEEDTWTIFHWKINMNTKSQGRLFLENIKYLFGTNKMTVYYQGSLLSQAYVLMSC